MTDEKPAESAPKREPKSPAWISNRIAEAIRGLRGAPRNIWTHTLEMQLQNALATSRAIHFAAARANGVSAEANSPSPATSSADATSSSTGS